LIFLLFRCLHTVDFSETVRFYIYIRFKCNRPSYVFWADISFMILFIG